jgi:hypothetical protein
MKKLTEHPESAYILPDAKTAYCAVWQNETRLCIRLLKFSVDGFTIFIDKKIIPSLIEALISLQNKK